MTHKIIICGGNGAGKSTLARSLAPKLRCRYLDIEDYYFPNQESDYPYDTPRTQQEATELLLADMRACQSFVLASVKASYGEPIESQFTCAVHLIVPKEVRMRRVRERAFKQFGDRVLPGGDLYEKQAGFFQMVQGRSEDTVTNWLKGLHVPVLEVDGTQPVEVSVARILRELETIPEG